MFEVTGDTKNGIRPKDWSTIISDNWLEVNYCKFGHVLQLCAYSFSIQLITTMHFLFLRAQDYMFP